jgi:hypothetical protein
MCHNIVNLIVSKPLDDDTYCENVIVDRGNIYMLKSDNHNPPIIEVGNLSKFLNEKKLEINIKMT